MSLSDKQNGDTPVGEEWKPLNVNGLEKMAEADIASSEPKPKSAPETFSVLYQLEKKKNVAKEQFQSFFSKDDIEASVDPPVVEDVRPATSEIVVPKVDTAAIEKKAYDEAFAQGEKAGVAAGEQSVQTQLSALKNMLDQVENTWSTIVRTYETQIVNLVLRAVDKVVYGIVQTDHGVIKRSVLAALGTVPEPVEITLNVSAKDYEYIEAIKEDFFREIEALKYVSVIADPAIKQGGCRIETKMGELNSTIESRLEAIKQSIIDAAK